MEQQISNSSTDDKIIEKIFNDFISGLGVPPELLGFRPLSIDRKEFTSSSSTHSEDDALMALLCGFYYGLLLRGKRDRELTKKDDWKRTYYGNTGEIRLNSGDWNRWILSAARADKIIPDDRPNYFGIKI